MKRDFSFQKNMITGTVTLLILADVAMAVYSAQKSNAPRTPVQELSAQNTQLKLLRKDVGGARAIKEKMPETKADCDRFENSMPASGTGYSAITSELTELGQKAGLQIAGLNFRQKEVAGRGLTEVVIDATVNGNYKSVVRYLNGLQRSPNVYIVDTLGLASEAPGQGAPGALRVVLHLRSYFKGS